MLKAGKVSRGALSELGPSQLTPSCAKLLFPFPALSILAPPAAYLPSQPSLPPLLFPANAPQLSPAQLPIPGGQLTTHF